MYDDTMFDIDRPMLLHDALAPGVASILAARPGAERAKLLAGDGGGSPPVRPAATPPPAPKASSPTASTTSVTGSNKPDTAKADAQAKAGVSANKPAPATTPTGPKPETKAKPEAKAKPDAKAKPETKAKATPAAPPADDPRVEQRAAMAAAKQQQAAKTDATKLDKTSPKQKEQLRKDQAALEAAEQQVRDARPETKIPKTKPGERPVNRAIADEIRSANAANAQVRHDEIKDLRADYFETHDRYVDADGIVYAASLSSTGDIVLTRDATIPKTKDQPQLNTTRTARITTSRSRTDEAVTSTEPTGKPGETSQKRTETINTDPKGKVVDSQVRVEQERSNADGSRDRSLTEEQYGPNGLATTRIQESEHTSSSGDSTLDRMTTRFRADGATAERTVSEHETHSGADDSSTSRTTTIELRTDGTTPTTQTVVSRADDADGARVEDTTAFTNYTKSGTPTTTAIRRLPDALPDRQSPTEYIVWNEDGSVDQKLTGGSGTSRYDFEQYVSSGTKPTPRTNDPEPTLESVAAATGRTSVSGIDDYQDLLKDLETAHKAWEQDKKDTAAWNADHRVDEVDPSAITDAENAVEWTRGGNDRFTDSKLGGNLVEPLAASTSVPSVFEIPGQLQARANAAAIDSSPVATDPKRFAALDAEQAEYEQQLAGAKSDDARTKLMRDYFSDHPYWIDRGDKGDAPVLMASGWSEGAPSNSDLFGATRTADPHATAARAGIEGVDDLGQPAKIDVVRKMFVDGSRDDIVRTSFEGPAGASRTSTTGEHVTAAGVVTELDKHAESMVPRTADGLPPLAVTETSRERFNTTTGKPQGEQYHAVATSDAQTTSLEEQRDYYNADGIIFDTKIDSTTQTRNYDADATTSFLDANAAAIDAAADDDFSPNDNEHESITVPPAGSSYVHTATDIDYDAEGVATHQTVDENSTQVVDSDAKGGNGVRVITTDTTRELGSTDGTAPIFDAEGRPAVAERVRTTLATSEFDPDAGVAGGNKSEGHQFRQRTSITLGRTIEPDGSTSREYATPLESDTLNEGFDDDWQFERTYLKTNAAGEVQTDDDGAPIELGKGDEVYNAAGEKVVKKHDGYTHEDLDLSDHFESFMEGWGGRIVGIAAIVAGIGGAVFTGGASLALTAVGVGLASTSFAYTAINYSQGEASGWDLALSGAGVALAGLPAITGVKQLANAGRAASAARATGAADDVVRTVSQQALRSGPGLGRTGTNVIRVGNTADNAMDANDMVDATRAALQGDFWGAGMMLLAVGGGAGAARVRARVNAPSTPTASTPTPSTSTAQGAPTVTNTSSSMPSPSMPLPGATAGAPSGTGTRRTAGGGPTPDSQVAAARGGALDADGATALLTPAPASTRPTSPTPTTFPDSVVSDPRAATLDPGAAWGGQARLDTHIDKHLSQYETARFEAAGLEPATTNDGRPITDAETYHQRALDYREMAVTGTLPDGVAAHPRANGGTMLVNSRTNEIAFINADGTVGSLYPLFNTKRRADGTYGRDGNPANRLTSYVQRELDSDALVYATRTARQNGDGPAMEQALESLNAINPRRHESVIRELETTSILDPHPGHGSDPGVDFGPLPTRDLAGPNVARIAGADGGLVVAYGRLPDGRIIVGEGNGTRTTELPSALIDRNRTRFVQETMPQGIAVTVRRSDGSFDHDWVVRAHNADGSVTVLSADGRLEKTLGAGEMFEQNLHLSVGRDTAIRIQRRDGTISDGWVPVSTERGEIAVVRREADGSISHESTPSAAFQALNADRILGAHGAYPGQDLRTSLGGTHATADPQAVEGVNYRRVGSGQLNQSGDYLFRGGIEVDYQGVTIRVEADPGAPTIDTSQQIVEVQRAIDAVPVEIRRNITEVNVLEGRNPQDLYWAQRTGDPNFRSGATAGGNTVNLYYGASGDVPSLFAHEATHTFGRNGGPIEPNVWEQAMLLDAAHLAQLGGRRNIRPIPYGMQLDTPAVSGYAQLQYDGTLDPMTGLRNLNEDWADTGGFIVQAERMGGVVATRRRWYGATKQYSMADLFPNRTAAFNSYRQLALAQLPQPHAMYAPAPSATGAGASASPGLSAQSLARKVGHHLFLSPQAMVMTNASMQTQQLIDRNQRAAQQELRELQTQIERLSSMQPAITD